MKRRLLLSTFAFVALNCALASAQAPQADIDPNAHGNLAAAQQSVIQAFNHISDAQRANDSHLGGHAGRAKQLLLQANDELRASAGLIDQREGMPDSSASPSGPPAASSAPSAPVGPPPNLSGNWTMFAEDAMHPGSSLKTLQLAQNGNILTGNFHGPNQHGKLQGWVQGTHVEFSTDTRTVLTFQGEITSSGMAGMYSVNGASAPWRAERTN